MDYFIRCLDGCLRELSALFGGEGLSLYPLKQYFGSLSIVSAKEGIKKAGKPSRHNNEINFVKRYPLSAGRSHYNTNIKEGIGNISDYIEDKLGKEIENGS